ncbi:transcription factor RelB-like [Teleopsis dalmanni]|uniref:transcription factor RelB-like n=1 Tax=Teleopsis dalmanni TaxID=139649 RepID=UPI0018CE8E3E|nr:transcription factor RelB-like [Teleopsis dalmanni]
MGQMEEQISLEQLLDWVKDIEPGIKFYIEEQPKRSYSASYKSEVGRNNRTLLGEHSNRECRTYPTVKLIAPGNSECYIEVSLCTTNSKEDNIKLSPHLLVQNDINYKPIFKPMEKTNLNLDEFSYVLNNCYILNTIQKERRDTLIKKYEEHTKLRVERDLVFNEKENIKNKVNKICAETSNQRSKNTVNRHYICFTAYVKLSDKYFRIAGPIFSNPIVDKELKIKHINHSEGDINGGTEVRLILENAENQYSDINVHLFATQQNDIIWESYGIIKSITDNEVIFETPPYEGICHYGNQIECEIEIIQLVDNWKSSSVKFIYKNEEPNKNGAHLNLQYICNDLWRMIDIYDCNISTMDMDVNKKFSL